MSKKKTRKAPAMAPLIRHRVDSSDTPDAAPASTRPDPDRPPMDGTTGRPSVYSEWLNNAPRPAAPSAWLNSPVGENTALRAAINDAGLGPQSAASPTPREPGLRQRRSTSARRLGQGDRLQVDPDTMRPASGAANDSSRQLAPTVPARPTRVLPAAPGAPGDRRARPQAPLGTMGTTGRMPAARPNAGTAGPRGTAGRIPGLADQATARMAASPRLSAGPAPAARYGAPAGPASRGGSGEAAREATSARVPATRQTGAPAANGAGDGSVLIRGARVPKATGPVVPRRLRPPSFVMQGVVALATVVMLMGVLTVSSPLGYGAALSGTFQSYANAVPWIPTPTPTPTATPVPPAPVNAVLPVSPGQQVIVNEITQIFGQYAQGALNVSHCESVWDPSARNPYPVGNSHAEGVFQILYPSTWDSTSYASRNPYDYDANIRAAWEIFHRDGNSWREWECQP